MKLDGHKLYIKIIKLGMIYIFVTILITSTKNHFYRCLPFLMETDDLGNRS
jgi:hypothetical protein